MRRYTVEINNVLHTIDVEETAHDTFSVHLADGRLVDATLVEHRDLAQALIAPGVQVGTPRSATDNDAGSDVRREAPTPTPARELRPRERRTAAVARGVVTAPMPGVVLSVEVGPGMAVGRGQTLLVLEAMKMKNDLRAEAPGVVSRVAVSAGDQVKHGDVLVEFEA